MEMKNLFLLLLIIAVSAVSSFAIAWPADGGKNAAENPLPGKQMCSLGSAYWCQNITQATKCNQVDFCASSVWMELTLPADDSNVCRLCKIMVNDAREYILSNATQDQLRKVLERSCRLIPSKKVSKQCVKTMDDYVVEINSILASRMKPQIVCAVCGLCNSFSINGANNASVKSSSSTEQYPLKQDLGDVITAPEKASTSKFDIHQESCPKCNFYLGQSISFLKKMSKEELKDALVSFCSSLKGVFSASCSFMIFTNRDLVYEHVQSKMNAAEICELVGLCEISLRDVIVPGKKTTPVTVWTPSATDGSNVYCDFCNQLVAHVKKMLTSNVTGHEFRNLTRGICKWAGSFRKECRSLAKHYKSQLYHLFTDESDSEGLSGFQLCPELGVCVEPEAPKSDSGNAQQEEVKVTTAAVNENPKVTCSICDLAMDKLIAIRGENKAQDVIRDAMGSVCFFLHETIFPECTVFMGTYRNQIEKVLMRDMTTMEICIEFGLCYFPKASKNSNHVTAITSIKPVIVTELAAPVNPTPAKFVKKQTTHLKDRLSSSSLKKGGKQDGARGGENISSVAKSDENESAHDGQYGHSGEWERCLVCEFIASRISPTCKSHVSQQQIRATAEKSCRAMSQDSVREECIALVDEYLDSLLEYLTLDSKPLEACASIDLCNDGSQNRLGVIKSAAYRALERIKTVSQGRCELCTVLAEYLYNILDDLRADAAAVNTVGEAVCPRMPARYLAECKVMAESFALQLVSLLNQGTIKEEVCSAISLCPTEEELNELEEADA